jgi:hypothetical protein
VAAINTTLNATGLQPNAAYQFRISGVSALGEGLPGEASDPVSTLPGPMPAPFQQAFLSTILLSWSPPANATTTGYRIYFQEFSTTTNRWLAPSVQVKTPSPAPTRLCVCIRALTISPCHCALFLFVLFLCNHKYGSKASLSRDHPRLTVCSMAALPRRSSPPRCCRPNSTVSNQTIHTGSGWLLEIHQDGVPTALL